MENLITPREAEAEDTRDKDQAKIQLESITEVVERLNSEDEEVSEEAREEINEDPLEVKVEKQYVILLCTGGPAVRIVGSLGEHSEPETAELQYQDWFKPWINYEISQAEEEVLLNYARQFYFG